MKTVDLKTAKLLKFLIYNVATGRADSWIPSSSDLTADDWTLAPYEQIKQQSL